MASAELEAKRCYNYILTVAPHVSDLAAQRAIWNIYKVEVGGYDRAKDTQKKKPTVLRVCREALARMMRGF